MRVRDLGRSAPALAALALACMAPAAMAAFDNFDSYANGVDLLGNGNGQMLYVNGSSTGTPVVAPDHLIAKAGDAISAPNAMEFTDPDNNGGGFKVKLVPAQAVDLTNAGSSTRIAFDYKTTDGYQGKVTLQMLALYSVNVNGGAEDYISNNHFFVITDSGLFHLDNANVLGGINNRWQANEWYNLSLDIVKGTATTYDYTMSITRKSDNFVLDTISKTGLTNANRNFLTGLSMSLSSNLNEVVLIDNLQIGAIPEPSCLAALGLGGLGLLRRRR